MRMHPVTTAEAEGLYRQLAHIIDTMPDLTIGAHVQPDQLMWLARAAAAVEAVGELADSVAFASATRQLGGSIGHDAAVTQIKMLLYRALARVEQVAPSAVQGAFIPVGHDHDVYVQVGKVLEEARGHLLIVDPYLDHSVLDFGVRAGEGVEISVSRPTSSPTLTRSCCG